MFSFFYPCTFNMAKGITLNAESKGEILFIRVGTNLCNLLF